MGGGEGVNINSIYYTIFSKVIVSLCIPLPYKDGSINTKILAALILIRYIKVVTHVIKQHILLKCFLMDN